jgi:cytochrome c-type biogenesis protein CcmH/NrfF
MTQLLQRALSEVQKLPDPQQDAIAAMILDELADEQHWEEQFAGSQSKLAQLANKAREAVRAGRVRQGGIDEL